MPELLTKLWKLLGIPQVWGLIVTIVVIATGVFLRLFIGHLFTIQVEKLKSAEKELEFIRQYYADINKYSSSQARALRQAYLFLYEPKNSQISNADASFAERADCAIQYLLEPLQEYIGILDDFTYRKIYAVTNYLHKIKEIKQLHNNKITFFEITEASIKFIKADRIAYRLGLIEHILNKSKEIKMVSVKILKEGIPIVGNRTYPAPGDEIKISQDEWESNDIQKLLKEKKIEKV